jgi:hypothetical protein
MNPEEGYQAMAALSAQKRVPLVGPAAQALALRRWIAEQDQVGAASHTEFVGQVEDMELDCPLGDVQFVCDLLVGKIFDQRVADLLLR